MLLLLQELVSLHCWWQLTKYHSLQHRVGRCCFQFLWKTHDLGIYGRWFYKSVYFQSNVALANQIKCWDNPWTSTFLVIIGYLKYIDYTAQTIPTLSLHSSLLIHALLFFVCVFTFPYVGERGDFSLRICCIKCATFILFLLLIYSFPKSVNSLTSFGGMLFTDKDQVLIMCLLFVSNT